MLVSAVPSANVETFPILFPYPQVTEVTQRNSGRDPFPKLLNRMRVPKAAAPRPQTAIYKIRATPTAHYHWSDLQVRGEGKGA
jgi:hypothetical protein